MDALGKQTLHSPKCCMSRNAIGTDFVEVQILSNILVYDWESRCPMSSAKACKI